MADPSTVAPNPSSALTEREAVVLAVAAANQIAPGHEFVALPGRTSEHVFGWVVNVVPRKYLETNKPGDLVPGVGALVVERRRKLVVPLPSSVPTDRAIVEYERRWKLDQ